MTPLLIQYQNVFCQVDRKKIGFKLTVAHGNNITVKDSRGQCLAVS